MADVFDLVATLYLDSSKYEQNLKDASSKTKQTVDKIGSALKLGAKIAAGAAVAITAVSAAAVKLSTKAATAADRVDKMSRKIGVSRTTFQELDFVLSQSGTSIETMQSGMKSLRSAMDRAASGTKKNVEQFKQLGVSVTDSSGNLRNQEDVMWDTVKALQGMKNDTERAKLATDLFGRAGTELLPLLNSEAGSVDELRQKAHELGLVMSDEAVDAGVKFTDSMDQVKRSFDAIVNQIGIAVMPVVQGVLDWVIDKMPVIQQTVGTVLSAVGGFISTVANAVGSVLKPAFDGISTFFTETFAPAVQSAWNDKIVPAFQTAFDAVKTLWDDVLSPVFSGIGTFLTETVAPAISTAWNEVIVPIFSAAFTAIDSVWNNVLKPVFTAIVGAMQNEVIPFLSDAWSNTILPTIQTVFTAAKTAWETVLRPALVGIYNYVSTVLAPGFKRFFENVIEPAVSTAFDGIKWVWENVLKKAFEDIKNFIEDPIIPIIGTLGEKFTTFKDEVLTPVATFISETLSGAFTTLKNIWVNDVQPKLQDLYNALSGFKTEVLDVIDSFIRDKFSKAFENLKKIWEGVKEALTPLKTSLDDFKKNTVEPIQTFIADKFSGAFKDVATFWNETLYPAIINVGGALKWVWENVFKKLAEYIAGGFTTAINGIKTVFDGIITFLNDVFHVDWDDAWEGITGTFGSIIKGIEDVILTPINNVISSFQDMANTVRGIIDGIVDRANKAVSWVKSQFQKANSLMNTQVGGSGGAGQLMSNWNSGKYVHRAGGGIVREGQRALVGEAGMEYLSIINGNAYVTPIGGRQAKNLNLGGGNVSNVTFNVYAQPGQDAEQIARAVQREFVRWEQQRKAAFV